MNEEIIKIKNEIGVEKEYTVISHYDFAGKEYRIYTDYTKGTEKTKIKLYVDERIGEKEYQKLSEEEQDKVIEDFFVKLPKEAEKIYTDLLDNMVRPQPLEETQKVSSKRLSLENNLQKALERNDPKKITVARGRLIKELKKEIKNETNEQIKAALQEKLRSEIKAHRTQLNERYKKEYKDVKKDFKSLFTALPAGLSLATKKIIATINDLKASKEGKKSFFEKLKDVKEIVQSMGMPIDYTIRFAINHWYILLLLLGSAAIKWKPGDKDDNKGGNPKPQLSPELTTETQEDIINALPKEEVYDPSPAKVLTTEVDPDSISANQQLQDQQLQRDFEKTITTEATETTPQLQIPPHFDPHGKFENIPQPILKPQPVTPQVDPNKGNDMSYFDVSGETYEPGVFDVPPESYENRQFTYDPNLSYDQNKNIFISVFGAGAAFLYSIFYPQSALTNSGFPFAITPNQPINADMPPNSL